MQAMNTTVCALGVWGVSINEPRRTTDDRSASRKVQVSKATRAGMLRRRNCARAIGMPTNSV